MDRITDRQATRLLCRESNWSVSNLKVQKLLYIAEVLFVGQHKGTDQLLSTHFEAWDYGPVIPETYQLLRIFGSEPIQNVFRTVEEIDQSNRERISLLKGVFASYGHLSAGKLVQITHWRNGAWAKRYSPGSRAQITRLDILEEYEERQRAFGPDINNN